MNFADYQKKSRETAFYPNVNRNFIYPVLGLAGESGEVVEKIKKVLRDKEGRVDEETKQEIVKEMGDVLWYLANLAAELGVSLEEVAQKNLEKLQSRRERNKLHGSGDNR